MNFTFCTYNKQIIYKYFKTYIFEKGYLKLKLPHIAQNDRTRLLWKNGGKRMLAIKMAMVINQENALKVRSRLNNVTTESAQWAILGVRKIFQITKEHWLLIWNHSLKTRIKDLALLSPNLNLTTNVRAFGLNLSILQHII